MDNSTKLLGKLKIGALVVFKKGAYRIESSREYRYKEVERTKEVKKLFGPPETVTYKAKEETVDWKYAFHSSIPKDTIGEIMDVVCVWPPIEPENQGFRTSIGTWVPENEFEVELAKNQSALMYDGIHVDGKQPIIRVAILFENGDVLWMTSHELLKVDAEIAPGAKVSSLKTLYS